MKNRIIIGVGLFVAFIVLAILDIFLINFVLFAIMLGLAFNESLKLYNIDFKQLYIVPLAFFCLLPFLGKGLESPFKIICLNLVVIASFLAYFKSSNLKLLLPFIYPTAPIFLMFGLYQYFGINVLFWLIFTVIATDSGAYFVGKMIGERPFSPSSPNKTLEGVVGGFVLGSVLGSIFAFIFVDVGFDVALLASVLISLFGIFGDLFESYLKRLAGTKDTSNLLGEHGGILDRIDGYLFGAFAVYLVIA